MQQGVTEPRATLQQLVNGYQVSQAIHVAATLGIADLLADGERSCEELAAATSTHADSLNRLLRALAGVGVFEERAGARFALTPLSEQLRAGAQASLAGWAAFIGRPYYWDAWAELLHSVRTGESGFRHLHGISPWDYRQQHPEENDIFNRAMSDTMSAPRVARGVATAYDFGRFGSVVDVGGGEGALLSAILAAHPGVRGVLFDLPHVVATARDVLERAGVGGRCEVVGGSFFDAVPAGVDVYVLKAVIHDWEDAEAKAILGRCRDAMPADGRVLVVERELAPANQGAAVKFSDLNMLVSPGGRERSRAEFEALFAAAGLQLAVALPAGAGLSVLEGVRA